MNEEELKQHIQTVMSWAAEAACGAPSTEEASDSWDALQRWLHPDWYDDAEE